jgi:hypothetical protein
MDSNLQKRIMKYVNKDNPLGPPDAHLIKDAEVAAHLFDPHNASFNTLLNRDISVVIGRRGSGKTALLNSYLYRPYFSREVLNGRALNFDLNDYRLVIPIEGNKLFERMQNHVAGPSGLLRPIESVIEDWSDLVIDYILFNIWQKHRESAGELSLLIVEKYLTAAEIRKKAEAYRQIWGKSIFDSLRELFGTAPPGDESPPSQSEALKHCILFLETRNLRAVSIFDSMDEYQTGDARADRTVGALLRFAAQFNSAHDRIKIKLGLPAEIFPEIQRASANPLKDFVNFDQVKWSSIELAQIAAYRYRLFLQIFDPDYYPELAPIELTRRGGAHRFWERFFPYDQVNRYHHSESPMTYMLRHTQLLPRQLFRILHRVIRTSYVETGGYRLLTSKALGEAIVDMESIIAQEIIQGFKHVYPFAEVVSKAIFGNFPTTFNYDQLEHKWRRNGRPLLREREGTFELVHFTEMLLRMGILGVRESETDRYVISKFAYNMTMPFSVGDRMDFSIHPVFSRYFGCAENRQRKAILPQGAFLEKAEF